MIIGGIAHGLVDIFDESVVYGCQVDFFTNKFSVEVLRVQVSVLTKYYKFTIEKGSVLQEARAFL